MARYEKIQEKEIFIILRSGLWGKADGELSSNPDWHYIYEYAGKQQIQGLITEGISVMGVFVGIPEQIFSNLIAERSYIIKRNIQVNRVQSRLCSSLDASGIPYAILKGQAVARSYANPQIRRSGDIDILLREEDFERTNSLLSEYTQETEYHHESDLHHALHIEDVWVETHAMAKAYFTRRLDRVMEEERRRMFSESELDCYFQVSQKISIPNREYTALFLLGHILRHLTTESISMKQLCDFAIYLNAQHGSLDRSRLVKMIDDAGIRKTWLMFSVFAVEWLGLNPDKAPLYETGHSEYGLIVWNTKKKVDSLRAEAKKRKIENFWLHYLISFVEFTQRNNLLWRISKRAFFERIWREFSPLPSAFFKKLFRIGGDKFHRKRFKQ